MRIYTLIISALAVVTAQAGPVDINKAKALAQKYVSSPISVETVSLAAMGKGKAQVAEPALHMFNNENGEGFVIVSADDRVGGVLGYSDRGSLDPQNMPTPLAALLASYTRAVETVRVDSVSVTPNYAKPPKAYVKPLVSKLKIISGELKPRSLYYFSFKKSDLMAQPDVTLTLGGGDIQYLWEIEM